MRHCTAAADSPFGLPVGVNYRGGRVPRISSSLNCFQKMHPEFTKTHHLKQKLHFIWKEDLALSPPVDSIPGRHPSILDPRLRLPEFQPVFCPSVWDMTVCLPLCVGHGD